MRGGGERIYWKRCHLHIWRGEGAYSRQNCNMQFKPEKPDVPRALQVKQQVKVIHLHTIQTHAPLCILNVLKHTVCTPTLLTHARTVTHAHLHYSNTCTPTLLKHMHIL